jgi:hypothetical protein
MFAQNSAQFMITRPRQMSLLQITLHFSCTVAAPQTGQTIADPSADEMPSTSCAFSDWDFGLGAFKT